ncbi:MAG: hypothetical protein ACRDGM_09750 [bacterium]
MRRRIVPSFIVLSGLVAGAGLLFGGLPWEPVLTWAVEAQSEPPSPGAMPADQPEVTERGLPGQPVPLTPGAAMPGIQSRNPRIRLLPKLPGSPPPPQALGPRKNGDTAPTHGPGLGQMIEAYRALPGGAEALEQARRRGAPIPSVGVSAPLPPRPWSVTLSPEVPSARDPANPSRSLGFIHMTGVNLRADWGNEHFLRSEFGYYDPRDGSFRTAPSSTVELFFHVPRDGWYMLNFEMELIGPPGCAGFNLVVPYGLHDPQNPRNVVHRPIHGFRSCDQARPARVSLPQLLELEAGFHELWLFAGGAYAGPTFARLLEASLTEFVR